MLIRPLVLLCLCFVSLPSATLRVCTSGAMEDGQTCDYTNLQTALDAARDGDTIIVKSGQTFTGNFRLAGGKSDITIKSSLADELAGGYRVERNSSKLAKLTTVNGSSPLTLGNDAFTATVFTGGTAVRISPAAAASTINVGDSVAMLGTSFSPYYCLGIDDPYKGNCTADRVGKFVWRGSTNITNGDVMYAHGAVLPQPLQPDTPYYVINAETSAVGGNNANPDRWQLSLTPDGPPITLLDWPAQTGLTFNTAPWPARNNKPMYVIARDGPNLTLAETPDGPPITWLSRGNFYTGGNPVRSEGTRLYVAKPVRNITLKGLEITESALSPDPYILLYLTESAHAAGEHNGITVQHCWIHGDDDATSQPHQGILANAKNLVVRDSIVEEIHSTYADTQAIGSSHSSGGWLIENNILSATGESIMIGGAYPIVFPNTPTGVTIRRNLFTKPKRWWHNVGFSKVDDRTVRIKRAYSPNNCDVDARGPSHSQCFWHDSDGKRHVISSDALIAFADLPASGRMVIYGTPFGVKGVHNLNGATIQCPEYMECSYSTNPVFPPLSTALGSVTISTGIITAQGSHFWSVKNAFEVKLGKTITVEGNIFEFAPAMGQDSLLVFNVTTGSGDTEPINYRAEATDYLIQNNIFRYAERAVTSSGRSYASSPSNRSELAGFGRSGLGLIRNNLFYSIGSDEWGAASGEGLHSANNYSDHFTFDHNTAIDISYITRHSTSNPYLIYTNNIFIPWGGTTFIPATGGDSAVDWMSLLQYNRVPNGIFSKNIVMNRNSITSKTMRGANYPDDTYLIQTNDDGRDPALLFTKWVERDYAASNYRIAPDVGSRYATTDGRRIGADMDELEAQTGKDGVDVVAGRPPFHERSLRQIEVDSTGAVLRYLPPFSSSSCTVQVWTTTTYSGTPVVDTTDAGAEMVDGRRVLRLSGLASDTPHYGKRWCDSEVDVFSFETTGGGMTLNAVRAVTEVRIDAVGGAADALIEYGASPSLGFTTPATECASGCALRVPANALYYRISYRNLSGAIIARGDIVSLVP